MKYLFSLFSLSAFLILGACNSYDVAEVVLTADKTEVAVGETVKFTVACDTDNYGCAKVEIVDDVDGSVLFEDDSITPSTSYSFEYSPSAAGKIKVTYYAYFVNRCSGNSYSSKLEYITVTE